MGRIGRKHAMQKGWHISSQRSKQYGLKGLEIGISEFQGALEKFAGAKTLRETEKQERSRPWKPFAPC